MTLLVDADEIEQDNVFQTNHNGVNDFVFNTEAHPFKVAGPPI
jgi:mannosyl-oligosaccharide alpha-1,2-mannosidase